MPNKEKLPESKDLTEVERNIEKGKKASFLQVQKSQFSEAELKKGIKLNYLAPYILTMTLGSF